MKPEELKAHLVSIGWEIAHSQHYVRELPLQTPSGLVRRFCRVKFNKHSVTIESQSQAGSWWFRIGGAPYDAVVRQPDGQISIGLFKLQ